MYNPMLTKVKVINSTTEKPTCGKCGKKHNDNSLKGMNNCFIHGKCGHKVRDIPNVRVQDMGTGESQSRGSNESPNKNFLYALRCRSEQETFLDVVTGMLKVFSIDVYVLFLVLLYHFYPYSS